MEEMIGSSKFALLAAMILSCAVAGAQAPPPQAPPPQAGAQPPAPAREDSSSPIRSSYALGPNDQITIRAFEVEEINDRPFRIDGDGYVNLPLLGRVKLAGLTVQEAEQQLTTLLKKYVKEPQVLITVTQFRSEPIFFVGAFSRPGIYPLQGRRTLVEMLSTIGGLQPNASRRIKLTRRLESGPIPLPNAVVDQEKKISTVEIGMGSLRENVNPAEDIVLQAFDIVTVERAEMVYVNGEVAKVGGFELGERESLSVVQLLTIAGGVTKDAKPEKARVLRPVLNTSRRAEVTINVKRIFEGKDSDYPLLPNDLLYIPRNRDRKNLIKNVALFALPLIPTIILLAIR
jgi:polysaccharide export outer membrane protein